MTHPARTARLLAAALSLATPAWAQVDTALPGDPATTLTHVGQAVPRLEKEIWVPYRSAELALLAIAREEPVAAVKSFRSMNGYTMPMAVDPSRSAFGKFASEGIPRTYVLLPEWKILFQTVGYDEADFAAMKQVIARALQRLKPPSSAGAPGR